MSHLLLNKMPECYLCTHPVDIENEPFIERECLSSKRNQFTEKRIIHELCAAELEVEMSRNAISQEFDYEMEDDNEY